MKNPPVAVSPNEVESSVSDGVVGKRLPEPAITGVSAMGAFRRVEPPQSSIGAGLMKTVEVKRCRGR